MAESERGSLAMELYNALRTFPFRGMVSFIRKSSRLTHKEFKDMELSKEYWLDTRNCKRGKKINKQCVFEMFGTFSNETASDVRAGMIAVIRLDLDYYKRIGHVILGFKNINLWQWMEVMEKPTVAADELAIFALSKLYGKHTVIYNKSKPWTTLDPPYQMSETELHDNCQIHLVYVGKDSYGILRHKPFQDVAAPVSLKSMLEPMKPRKVSKRHCQSEPLDLSVPSTSTHIDDSRETELDNSVDTVQIQDGEKDQTNRPATPIPELGESVELGPENEVAVPVNVQHKQPDPLCNTRSEVKLHRLTNSELERYLGRVDPYPDNCTKGDNTKTPSPKRNTNLLITPQDPLFSRSGRPLRSAVNKASYMDALNTDSSSDEGVLKVNNNEHPSRPKSSGPSAARIAAQHGHTVQPLMGLKPSNVYKRSASPVYSANSKETSVCSSDASDLDSDTDTDTTFQGFAPLSKKDLNTLGKLGKLQTTQYGLRRRKRVRSYICHEEGCNFIGKAMRELNEHHIQLHDDVSCNQCDKKFKTPSSLQRHSYSHGELNFPCDQCEEAFAFKSELRFHKSVHRTIPTYKCMSKNCGKSYKSENELNKHVLKHSGMMWDCNEIGCTYSTDDRRNLRAHKRKHVKVGSFICVPCVKNFKYFMQLKRHRLTPECKANRAE